MSTNEESIFSHALGIHSPDDRAAYLEEVCAADPETRRRIELLLRSHDEASGLLNPAALDTAELLPAIESAGATIGMYKLLQQIGEGGFGVVYMAEQQKPVRRRVALKIIKPGMDTKEVVARFEAERQALALLDHPNIATVFDAGATATGRPYFVMELVKGVPLNEFCDENNLPARQRLELFSSVCHAVQHAHQKGIIHRDLKPSNVMVTIHDNKPVPKVIDFGVSKSIGQELTQRTLFTAYGQMVGTPVYMSPEQAQMSGLDVDTRSDIYSLGIMLFELLTGSTPLDAERLRKSGYAEMQRLIREEEAPKPSDRLSTQSAELLAKIAKQRGAGPGQLNRQVRGELDWIVMKTLEKDRNQRYESANSLVADIKRYLKGDPVQACPPSAAYRVRKFVRRYKTQVAVASGFLTLLLTSSIVAWLLYADASKARDEVLSINTKLVEQRDRAIDAERASRIERERAQKNLVRAVEQEKKAASLVESQQRRLYDYNIIKAASLIQRDKHPSAGDLLGQCPLDLRSWEWHRLDRQLGRIRIKLEGPPVLGGTSSSTRFVCAVVDEQGDLRLHDSKDGRALWAKRSQAGPYVRFSPNGELIAVSAYPGYGSGRLELWNTDGEMLWSIQQDTIGWIAFGPDSRYLAFSTVDLATLRGEVALHEATSPTPLWKRPCRGTAFMSFGTKSEYLYLSLSTSRDFFAPAITQCWSLKEGREVWSKQRESFSVPYPTNDGLLLVGRQSQGIEVLDATSGERVTELSGSGFETVVGIRASKDGHFAIATDAISAFVVWDLKAKQQKRSLHLPQHCIPEFTPNGDAVAAPRGTHLDIYPINPPTAEIVLSGHDRAPTVNRLVKGIAFSADGNFVYSAGRDGQVRTWNVTNRKEHNALRAQQFLNDLAYSSEGRVVAVGGLEGLQVYSADTAELLHHWPEAEEVWCLDVSSDGKRIVAGGGTLFGKKVISLFDIESRQLLMSSELSENIDGVVFDTNSKYVVSVKFASGQLDLWDLESGESQVLRSRTTNGSHQYARRLERSPRGNLVAFAINDTIELWDLDRKELVNVLPGDGDAPCCMTFNRDGSRLFAGDAAGNVKIWNIDTEQLLLTMPAHQVVSETIEKRALGVQSIALSQDGLTLATGGADGFVKLWESSLDWPVVE